MWSSTVGLVNGKHRYLTAETFGFKISSNGQQLKRRQQWTIEPFPENTGPDGSISSAASVTSQCPPLAGAAAGAAPADHQDPCILTLTGALIGSSLSSMKSSSNGSASSDQDACGEEHENVALKSHLNKYLAVDSFGNVTCDSDEKSENARFTITICSMSQGRSKEEHIFWAFKNVERGYYLGTTEDGMICCNAKMPKSRAELWHLHLLPARGASFFAIKSLGRKRFARVTSADESGPINQSAKTAGAAEAALQVQLDANISWGSGTLFQFKYHEGGRYSLLTSDEQLLTNEGRCLGWTAQGESELPPAECLFTLEYHSGYLAFRDSFSQYLAAAGRSSILRSRSIGVSRDELFMFESVPIQVSLKATFNNRWVSIKQGVDLSANQTETTSKFETFQLTYQKQTQNWSIMTHDCNYWTVSQNTSTVSVCRPGDYEGLTRGQFRIVWSESDASFRLKFVDINQQERWISARKSGQLFLASANHDPVKFVMRFQSRRLLNLRPVDGSGFVGLKSAGSKYLEANKTAPDSIVVEYSDLVLDEGRAQFAGQKSELNGGISRAAPEQKSVGVFDVRLNPTNANHVKSNHQFEAARLKDQSEESEQNGGEDFGIDANNNCVDAPEKPPVEGSGVETTSAPSVASIINSFSNTKITSSNGAGEQNSNGSKLLEGGPVNSSVSKLASSFESGAAVQSDGSESVVTLCSSVSGYSSSSANGNQTAPHATAKSALADQVAQLECCQLRMKANGKYLTVEKEGNESSIICDATNRTCAQSWVLELRSHNSIAIRASDNHAYMQMGTNGTIFLSRCDSKQATLWEF